MSMRFSGEIDKVFDRVKPKLVCGEGRTKQSFGPIADINSIVARWNKTGSFDYVSKVRGAFADVSTADSYQDMLNKVNAADAAFSGLPSAVRTRFDNSPVKLIEFLQDVKNRDEAIRLGLIPSPAKPVPVVPVDKPDIKPIP